MIACIERCEGVIWRHGDRLRRKKRKCHDIFSKVLRRAISTPVGHSVSFFVIPERLASIRSVVLAF